MGRLFLNVFYFIDNGMKGAYLKYEFIRMMMYLYLPELHNMAKSDKVDTYKWISLLQFKTVICLFIIKAGIRFLLGRPAFIDKVIFLDRRNYFP